jgi:hypothetical protein
VVARWVVVSDGEFKGVYHSYLGREREEEYGDVLREHERFVLGYSID